MNCSHKTGSIKQNDLDLDNLSRAVYKVNKVVALGNFASEALLRVGKSHFKLPHPSPLNRQINDPHFIENCLNNCRQFISQKH